ncbi:MAG: pyrroline-5-carboxylate reductase [Opitutaceae bacterium]
MAERIAFLGAGNMAAAIVDGLIAAGSPPGSLVCFTASGRSAAALTERTGMRRAGSLEDLLDGADALVVAFKPQHLAAADPRLSSLCAGKLVISVLAGKRLARLGQVFPNARNVVRTMPNTPARIGAGITGWCSAAPLSTPDRAFLARLLRTLGQDIEIPEGQMDALTAVGGSGPAYVFEFAAALREAGVAAGLAPANAERLASETLLGAARLLARRGVPPEQLRDEVTSPNGTTFAALQRLAAGNFRGLIREAVLAAKIRSEELSLG